MEATTITEKWYKSHQGRSKTPDEHRRFWLKSRTNLPLRLGDQMNKVWEASENKQTKNGQQLERYSYFGVRRKREINMETIYP